MMIITTHFAAMAQSELSGIEEDGIWMDWRERMKLLNYTPRYFGPNAFPFSELTDGRIGKRWELELRGEYHEAAGDRTADLFARLCIPVDMPPSVVRRSIALATLSSDPSIKWSVATAGSI